MEMAKIRFLTESDADRIVDLAKEMSVVALRGEFYVIPAYALGRLDGWGCDYEVVERGGYDALVAGPLRGVAASSV